MTRESLEETLAWLSDPELRRRVDEGEADLDAGRVVTGEELARRYLGR